MPRRCFLIPLMLALALSAHAETPVIAERMRPGFALGMGVAYINPTDVVDMLNGAFRPTERLPDFHAGVNFFASGFVPLSPDWMLKIEYAYLLNTYNITAVFGPGEFTMRAHMPTVYVHYMLVDEGLYNLSGGIGVGYHFGALDTQYGTLIDTYTAHGVGGALDLQGNTAISENLFVHLDAQARWEYFGELHNAAGKSPGVNARGEPAVLSWFSVDARIGFSYYL
jgi:hypothetical protein